MKTPTLWINFITHSGKRTWKWKPWFIKSQIVFVRGGKAWLAPFWEIGWGCFVFHWTGYSHEKVYKGNYVDEHECPSELMQGRINELEHAIRKHRDRMETYSDNDRPYADRILWRALKDI